MNKRKTILGKLFGNFLEILSKIIFQNDKFSISRTFEQKSNTSFTICLTKVSKCDNAFRLHFSLNPHQIKPSLNNLIIIIQHLIIMTNKNTLIRFSHTNFYVLFLLTNYSYTLYHCSHLSILAPFPILVIQAVLLFGAFISQ